MIGGLTFTIGVRAHIHQSSLRLVGIAVEPRLVAQRSVPQPLSPPCPTELLTALHYTSGRKPVRAKFQSAPRVAQRDPTLSMPSNRHASRGMPGVHEHEVF